MRIMTEVRKGGQGLPRRLATPIVVAAARTRLTRLLLFVGLGLLAGGLGGGLTAVILWLVLGSFRLGVVFVVAFVLLGLGASLYVGWPSYTQKRPGGGAQS